MQFKKIVGFGDSWVWGDELFDPALLEAYPLADPFLIHNTKYRESNCFLGRLGKHYSVPVENFGIAGGSLQSTIWTFLWWLNHEPDPSSCLILIGLTNSYRFSYYNPKHVVYDNDPPWNRFVHSAWPRESKFQELIKQQTVLTDCKELHQLNFQQAVLTFDGIAARQILNLIQFKIFPEPRLPYYIPPTLIDSEDDLKTWLDGQGQQYLKPRRHPNENGHDLISQRLISRIDSCIINE
jgi:hypothetical protein